MPIARASSIVIAIILAGVKFFFSLISHDIYRPPFFVLFLFSVTDPIVKIIDK